MKKNEISVQNLVSDRDEKIVLTLCVIAGGFCVVMIVFGLLFMAALFT